MFYKRTARLQAALTSAMNRRIWDLIGILVVVACLTGLGIEAQAETMTCRTAGVLMKFESMPVAEVGHALVMGEREGLAFFENGEIAVFKSQNTSDSTIGGGFKSDGYMFFRFDDGSSIVTTFSQQATPEPGGKYSSKMMGEILKGTGRFDAIKGSLTMTSKRFADVKGEANKSSTNITFTYTLPSR